MRALVVRLCAAAASFAGAAALTTAALGEETPRAPVVIAVVIDCDLEGSCTVWPATTGCAAGDAGEER